MQYHTNHINLWGWWSRCGGEVKNRTY